jgi:hypothetical protein
VVYVDDGVGGGFVEANSDNDALVRSQPTLRQLVITRVSTVGAAYRVKVVAQSETGQATSPVLGTVLAALPLQPPAPALAAPSSSTAATVDVSAFPSASASGCSPTSFDIQRDDGLGGNFTSLVGLASPYLLATLTVTQSTITPITRGRTYRFRYRVQNCIGWGPFSPEL